MSEAEIAGMKHPQYPWLTRGAVDLSRFIPWLDKLTAQPGKNI